jgi:hypothetical protein
VTVKPLYLVETLSGGLLVYAAVKNYTLSSLLGNLLKGKLGGTVNAANGLGDVSNAPAVSTPPVGSTSPSGAAPSGASGQMLRFMESIVGKPYSESTATNPATGQENRFGPSEYDCSGAIYTAANKAGINLPASQAIASSEAQWFAALSGATHYTSASNIGTGDILFFTGASPDPSSFGPIGHVGMASSATELVSAYDTQQGVCYTPISQDAFVVGVRLK